MPLMARGTGSGEAFIPCVLALFEVCRVDAIEDSCGREVPLLNGVVGL